VDTKDQPPLALLADGASAPPHVDQIISTRLSPSRRLRSAPECLDGWDAPLDETFCRSQTDLQLGL